MTVKIECVCPLTAAGSPRHPDGDRVELRDKLDFRSALTARNAIVLAKQDDPGVTSAEILAILTEHYLCQGITSWTLVDAKGKHIEADRANIRKFIEENPEAAMEVGDEADSLYSEAVILPLVARAQKSSPPTRTDGSTSPTIGSEQKRPKPSKPSLTSTTRTAGTVRTSQSPAGVSN